MVWATGLNALIVVYMNWCVAYAPQEVFGTTQGFFSFAAAIPQSLFVAPLTVLMPQLFAGDGLMQYIVPFTVLNVITSITALAFIIRLCLKRPPQNGMVVLRDGRVVNLEDEQETT